MKKNLIVLIALISAPSAIVVAVVLVLKLLGYDNPAVIIAVIIGVVVGGIVGALSSLLLKKKKLK